MQNGEKWVELLANKIGSFQSMCKVKPVYSGHLGTSLRCPGQFTCKWVLWDHY